MLIRAERKPHAGQILADLLFIPAEEVPPHPVSHAALQSDSETKFSKTSTAFLDVVIFKHEEQFLGQMVTPQDRAKNEHQRKRNCNASCQWLETLVAARAHMLAKIQCWAEDQTDLARNRVSKALVSWQKSGKGLCKSLQIQHLNRMLAKTGWGSRTVVCDFGGLCPPLSSHKHSRLPQQGDTAKSAWYCIFLLSSLDLCVIAQGARAPTPPLTQEETHKTRQSDHVIRLDLHLKGNGSAACNEKFALSLLDPNLKAEKRQTVS